MKAKQVECSSILHFNKKMILINTIYINSINNYNGIRKVVKIRIMCKVQ